MKKAQKTSSNNMFWNIDKKDNLDMTTIIEHTLKYGDYSDVQNIFKKYNKEEIKKIWLQTMAYDKRFIKINLMIARIFFDMDIESSYFKRQENGRFEVRVFIK